ncbi:CPBP family intramembrane glutamic endopeptidase [Alteromonas gracilis]|uniref:CPBP family intramembrane glutamic endopeptidase n=1 Tax=Alteromonas gracilis TaxID=1479524 RepID=UPI003736F35A
MKISKESALTLVVFLSFVTLFYFVGFWLIFRMAQATPLMLSVGFATIATCLVRGKKLSSLGWGWGPSKYQWMSYLLPFLIVFVSYSLIWAFGFGDFYNADFLEEKRVSYNLSGWNDLSIFLFHFTLTALVGFVISLPTILGEEIGWRGLLVPELSKSMSFTGVILVSGVIWSMFHWPLIFYGMYGNQTTSIYYQLSCFTVFIIATGTIMAYIRLKTNSVWTAVMYHASSNIFIQKVFNPMTIEKETSLFFVDEFGIVLAIVASIVAFFFWLKGKKEFPQSRLTA